MSFSGAELLQAVDRLNRDALIPATAWSIDPASNQVVVTTDETVTGAKLDRLTAITDQLGDRVRVRVESTPGTLTSSSAAARPSSPVGTVARWA